MNQVQVKTLLNDMKSRNIINSEIKNGIETWSLPEKTIEILADQIKQDLASLGFQTTDKFNDIIVSAMKGKTQELASLAEATL